MNAVALKPIREKPADFEDIEKRIIALFKREIYAPLMKELGAPASTLKNSVEDLCRAISSGRLRFHRGSFTGRLDSTLSRELRGLGAQWDRTQGAWKIPLSKLPRDVQTAIGAAEAKAEAMAKRIDKKLEELLPAEIADRLKVADLFDRTIYRVDSEFKKNAARLGVAPELTKEARKKIADEWANNMNLYIKKFTEEEITRLRKDVQRSTLAGVRYESMVSTISKSYGVSQRKAKFLARQETSLLRTKIVETRYREVGVEQYRWQAVAGTEAHPTRKIHKELSGKIFTWDNPPVTSEDGRHNHPGQDFNCRCVAIPLVKVNKK